MALATTRKSTMTVAAYLAKMQSLGNDIASAGKSLDDEDLVQYIPSGLDEDYNSIINFVLARAQPITVSELSAQMLSFNFVSIFAMVALVLLWILQGEAVVASAVADLATVVAQDEEVDHQFRDMVVKAWTPAKEGVATVGTDPSVRCVSNFVTQRTGAGTDSRKIMFLNQAIM
jgi:hypothetical protein